MKLRLACLASALAVAPISSPAQREGEHHDLQPLVVTAARVPIQPANVIQSVTVITREDMEQRQAVRVVDLLRDVPGLSVARAGPVGGQTQVRVRGAEANHVLVMIDGIQANDPANVDDFRFEYLLTADVERIEIVRGPQSALWGTDALAGVINVITRSAAAPGGSAFIETGSHGTLHGGANLDFTAGPFQVHLGAVRFDTDGSNVARQGGERDGSENTTVTATLKTDPTRDAGFDAMLRQVEASSEIDAIDFLETGLPTDADLVNDADRAYLRLSGYGTSRDGRLTHRATVAWLDTESRNRGPAIDSSTSAAERLELRYQASWELRPEHRLTAALEHEAVDFSQRGAVIPFGDPNQDQSMKQTGLALDYLAQAGARWDWNLSARHDLHSDFEDATTVRGALAYRVSERGRLRAVAGTGRKAPTFTDRFGFFPDQFIGNPDLEPESSRSVELGYEHGFETGLLGITVFGQDLEEEINGFVFDPETGRFTARNQAGESRRNGLELIAEWQPAPGWSIAAHYTYTDATETAGERETDEIRRPRHAGSVNLNFASSGGRANANLNLNYNGTATDTFFPPFPASPTTVVLDHYLLVDLAARWRVNDRFEVFGRVNNLLGEDYENVFGFANPGRTAMAGLRFRFGP